jgi:hypothetical protein
MLEPMQTVEMEETPGAGSGMFVVIATAQGPQKPAKRTARGPQAAVLTRTAMERRGERAP